MPRKFEISKLNSMTLFNYIVWLIAFLAGVAAAFIAPESSVPLAGKFVFLGAWGAVLGFVLYTICKKKIESTENDFNENLMVLKENNMEFNGGISHDDDYGHQEDEEPAPAPAPMQDLPKGAISAKEALEQLETAAFSAGIPLDPWKNFARAVLKNRPFKEVIAPLQELLPQLFPKASGVLYMYAGTQADLHKVLSFGDQVISDDVIHPGECASFDAGDIVISDYSNPNLTGGCTHLHHHPKGVSFCAPIEGLEEHFGIFTMQTDVLPDQETVEDWHAKVSILATAFGLYVANQNLKVRFEQHSIRDTLTGLFNRRYMEESLQREVSAAARHKTPIGLIMLYPDAVNEIQSTRGRHAVEQLLWELGQRLPGYIRNEDIPCRFEGEMFCVILPGADLKITRQRAEKIRNEIAQLQIAYGDTILSTTLSMGVSVMPTHANDAASLLYAAQASMQYALQAGTNRVILADVLSQK
ncbi:diguanylate cyclase (GGDEF) domain-containing protein [Fibrobacter sp. UWEL]|nr:diguanylate cyclase (GGDEF) domain-containing protein [Fibrobacter sp. UWEL]